MEREKERARIIAFLGIDGSGKSTQARSLADWLAQIGWPATCLKTSRGRAKLDRAAQAQGHEDLAAYVGDDAAVLMQAALGWWGLYEMRRAFRPPGSFVVMDRYTYCHMAMGQATAPAVVDKLRGLFRRYPEPDLVFFVDVPPAVAHARTLARDARATDTLDGLTLFDCGYRALPEFGQFVPVDGNRAPDAIQAEIRAVVTRRFGLAGEA